MASHYPMGFICLVLSCHNTCKILNCIFKIFIKLRKQFFFIIQLSYLIQGKLEARDSPKTIKSKGFPTLWSYLIKRVGNFPRQIWLLSAYKSHTELKHLSNSGYGRNNNLRISDSWENQRKHHSKGKICFIR